ncbi:hypothetical protein VMT65_34855 [Nocardia sp. CDC153]|uniref:hypothetical protein n=1 Tax=Nocardia sp. CDC153 TaxID=3112167 RepID=UPI002DC03017|nr:hypothetical protein [Nocardia sp. CDC153]MEC3958260.1 hypothetical protein [Nocardia sp. CDC153]
MLIPDDHPADPPLPEPKPVASPSHPPTRDPRVPSLRLPPIAAPEPTAAEPESVAAQAVPDPRGGGLELPPLHRMAPGETNGRSDADDPPPGAGERSEVVLPPGVEAVVMRWNPHGLALLRAMVRPARVSTPTVALLSADESHAPALRVEFARFLPRIDVEAIAARADRVPDEAELQSVRRDSAPVPVALVVLEAGALIGEHLITEVRRLRAEGTRIVFALDGIHAHREWREVRKLDLELLAEVEGVGGEEIVPVSARLAAVGRASGDAALVDRSGVGLLHARLVAAAGAGAVGDQVAIVRERVLADTRRRIRAQVEKLRGRDDVAALREERARLLAVNDGGRGSAMAVVRNRVQLARVDLLHEVGARIRALHTDLRAEIDGLARGSHAEFSRHVSESVEKLTCDMDRAIRFRMGELCRQVEESVAEEWHISFPPPAERGSRSVPTPGPRLRGVEDHLVIALGASAGFGLGRLVAAPLSLLPALDYAIMPVGLALGAAAASWFVRARRHLADGAHLRQWVADALVDARAQLEARVATALVDAEERLTDEVLGSATARMVEIDLRVGELEEQLRQAAHRRPALLQACERDLAALEFA